MDFTHSVLINILWRNVHSCCMLGMYYSLTLCTRMPDDLCFHNENTFVTLCGFPSGDDFGFVPRLKLFKFRLICRCRTLSHSVYMICFLSSPFLINEFQKLQMLVRLFVFSLVSSLIHAKTFFSKSLEIFLNVLFSTHKTKNESPTCSRIMSLTVFSWNSHDIDNFFKRIIKLSILSVFLLHFSEYKYIKCFSVG